MEGVKKLNYVGPGGRRKRITKVVTLPGFELQCSFDDGEVKILKVKPLISKTTEWTKPILDESYFKQVFVDEYGNLAWPNEFGFESDFVYHTSTKE